VLMHPWDAALDDAEWQRWVAGTDRFGMLAVNNVDLERAPIVLPSHFTLAGLAGIRGVRLQVLRQNAGGEVAGGRRDTDNRGRGGRDGHANAECSAHHRRAHRICYFSVEGENRSRLGGGAENRGAAA
jgi:hypothetical protein